jgi:hypothetical protein
MAELTQDRIAQEWDAVKWEQFGPWKDWGTHSMADLTAFALRIYALDRGDCESCPTMAHRREVAQSLAEQNDALTERAERAERLALTNAKAYLDEQDRTAAAIREALMRCAREVAQTGTVGGAPRNPDIAAFRVTADIIEAIADREYTAPAPAPQSVTLSDGSVVTRGSDDYWRRSGGQPTVYGLISRHWVEVLRAPDTGADFDALKALAATVGGGK